MSAALIWAAAALAITGTLAVAGLRAWRGWLDLRRFEIASERSGAMPDPSPGVRIEIANLKERLRKLEAIAQGVDL